MSAAEPAPTTDAARVGRQLRQIAALSRRFENQLSEALEVNRTDLRAMEHLMREGPLSPGALATRLELTSAAGTQVVDRLVAAGHVRRDRAADDRRQVIVSPVDASVERARGEVEPMAVGVGAIVRGLSARDVQVVEDFLDGVIEVYRTTLENAVTSAKTSHRKFAEK
jgi:DNA-binding MarR family transcriptional regulator